MVLQVCVIERLNCKRDRCIKDRKCHRCLDVSCLLLYLHGAYSIATSLGSQSAGMSINNRSKVSIDSQTSHCVQRGAAD